MLFPMEYEDVLGRLKQLSKERGLSQADLAQALGVTRAAVGNWWQGARRMRWESLAAWADLLGYELMLSRTEVGTVVSSEDEALLARIRAALPLMSSPMRQGIATFADMTLAESQDTQAG